ncbi:M48 family metallopeptidase [Actinoplanes bogorensis]|uniref:M48 family metallopeptidase n=1 Tax=Paractinoplanes bogorensis TaxID=1610840 RepID=A0ABS5Z1M9_9ACTN|nr:M48 family metallopeptidase [Actinoplanes bogorensis]MBU2669563.1 M48 family metallopeptidase [Actinoplanes bogorensis]
MLVGFLAVAWLQVAAVLLVVLLVLEPLPGEIALQVAVPLVIAVAGLLWWATVRALRLRRPAPAGVPVLRQHAPALWTMIDDAAVAAGVKPPGGVTIVAGATASLTERSWLGGLAGGHRELYLGLPLLQAWDESRVRAVVAHELAHGSPALGGRFAPLARRGRLALGRIVPRIPRRSPAGPLLRAYAKWYRAVDTPYSHAHELAADRVAAGFAGPQAAAAVLRDGPALEAMQQLFHAEYLSPGWQTGLMPDDVFGGLLRVLAARGDDMAALRAREPEPPGEWDPHPPRAERLAALAEITPEGPEAPGRPAGEMVPGLPDLGRALQAVAFPIGGRAVVGWDEFFGVARIAEMEREADASLRALSRAAGAPVTGAAEVLDLSADGRLRKIAETVFGDLPADEVSSRITDLIALLLALAALHSGVARWRHSWTGTAELVAADGSYLELHAPAEAAGDPATVGRAREWLTSLGVDLTATASTARHHSSRVPVLGGVVGVQVDGARTDLLVLETGLFLVPALPRTRHHEARRRLTRLAGDGVLTDGSPAVATAHATALGSPAAAAASSATPPGSPAAATTSSATASGSTEAATASSATVPGSPAAATASEAMAPGSPAALAKTATATLEPEARAAVEGSRFVPFADVATASATRNGRRAWEINMRDGGTLTVRTTLDSEELPGGWAALDDAVAFLTRTR